MSKLSRIVDHVGVPGQAEAVVIGAFSRLREPTATSDSVLG